MLTITVYYQAMTGIDSLPDFDEEKRLQNIIGRHRKPG